MGDCSLQFGCGFVGGFYAMAKNNNNGTTKINNSQRQAFAKIITEKGGKTLNDERFENRVEKETAKKLEELETKHKAEIEFVLKAKAIEKKLEKAGLDLDYDRENFSLKYDVRKEIETKFYEKEKNEKEKAVRDIWASKSVEEAKEIVNNYLAKFVE